MAHEETLRIGLAQVANVPDYEDRLATIDRVLGEAAAQGVAIVCFPETYLPGLRGMDFHVDPPDQARQQRGLAAAREMVRHHGVALILPMEWEAPHGQLNLAWVIGRDGEVLGAQTKNQVAPSEDPFYVPGTDRHLFAVDGVPFGVTICHEGWRYPEATRWAARHGAPVVFHPNMAGSDAEGTTPAFFGDPAAPYYEKALLARAAENHIYFASVGYAVARQEAATCVIGPDLDVQAIAPYGEETLLVHDLDLAAATRLYAERFDPAAHAAG